MYGRLKPSFVLKSMLGLGAGGLGGFVLLETLTGNEQFYHQVLMPTLHRLFEPEVAHRLSIAALQAGVVPLSRKMRREYAELEVHLWNRQFANPIGLAAGFDKNGQGVSSLCKAGFGFIELGTVTPQAQPGNDTPRVFRLTDDEALINRCGFNNRGFQPIQERLRKLTTMKCPRCPLAVNFGCNKSSVDKVADYVQGVRTFSHLADLLVVNISSPNTIGLRQMQEKAHFEKLLQALANVRQEVNCKIPLLVKVSPDLSMPQKEEVAKLCLNPKYKVDGIIVANTTVSRPSVNSSLTSEQGGLSGPPLKQLSTDCIRDFYRLTTGRVPIVGCGGVANGRDAYEKIKAGASLVQLYTALTYHGLPLIGLIKEQLVDCLQKDGYKSIAEAVGSDLR